MLNKILNHLVEFLIVITIVAIILMLVFGAGKKNDMTDNFRAKCEQAGGNPAYNGRHWECLK